MGCIESWELGWFASISPSLFPFVRSFVRSFVPPWLCRLHLSTFPPFFLSLSLSVSPFPSLFPATPRPTPPLSPRNPLSAARLRVKPPKKGCSSDRATSQNAVRAIPRVSRVMDETRPPFSFFPFHLPTRSSTFFPRPQRTFPRSDESQKVRV